MSNLPAKRDLPKIADLHHDLEVAFKNDELNLLLNQPVPKTWLRNHPTATKEVEVDGNKVKVPVVYIPIERVEFLLTRIFQQWKVEVISYQQLFQSVAVQVRLHYVSPLDGNWYYQDGLGAVGVQTDKGKSAADLAAIKSDAVMKALPAAESYAVKDAAEKLGKLFGKDLNRREDMAFDGTYVKERPNSVDNGMITLILSVETEERCDEIYDQNPEYHHLPEFSKKLMERKQQIRKGGNDGK